MNKTKLLLLIVMCVMAISYNPKLAFAADPGPDAAECDITITVDSIIEWEGLAFAAIDLDSQASSISAQADSPEGSAVYTLWTNCNVELSADNTATAQLTDGTDVLVTKYKISTDGAGVTETGATVAAVAASGSDVYALYNLFLATPLDIAHFNTDGAVEVTLEVEATNPADEVADSGAYTATQTITATWTSDN
ncbi:MAG: hypothetical protein CVV39_02990 [Planctomycetes bacterium HGW-Planctomycetes-1]|nr:MAG: hypothetical protein CVV39_02990 [Planctomycetes bacterium HGW-Planctomycetes-1]